MFSIIVAVLFVIKKVLSLLDVQSSTEKKLATTQDRQTLQNSDEKQYCQDWMLRFGCYQLDCPQRKIAC